MGKITSNERAEMNRLRLRGVKCAVIAARFGLSASQVSEYTSDSMQARQAKRLRKDGHSVTTIAEMVGVAKGRVSKWTARDAPENGALSYSAEDVAGILYLRGKGYSERVIAGALGVSRTRLRSILQTHGD